MIHWLRMAIYRITDVLIVTDKRGRVCTFHDQTASDGDYTMSRYNVQKAFDNLSVASIEEARDLELHLTSVTSTVTAGVSAFNTSGKVAFPAYYNPAYRELQLGCHTFAKRGTELIRKWSEGTL